MNRERYLGVIGAGECSEETFEQAREIGRLTGLMGWTLVCGGLGGVMEGAAKRCLEAGGLTVGLLPGMERSAANPHIRVAIPTGLGEGRNLLVVRASDVLIAVSGGFGTLSEIAFALQAGKTVIGLDTWKEIDGVLHASTAAEAFERARSCLSLAQSR
jgi:uncharacterized protein (TIGR00725 family)